MGEKTPLPKRINLERAGEGSLERSDPSQSRKSSWIHFYFIGLFALLWGTPEARVTPPRQPHGNRPEEVHHYWGENRQIWGFSSLRPLRKSRFSRAWREPGGTQGRDSPCGPGIKKNEGGLEEIGGFQSRAGMGKSSRVRTFSCCFLGNFQPSGAAPQPRRLLRPGEGVYDVTTPPALTSQPGTPGHWLFASPGF